ncbi:MAG: 1-deoxy-D-xylulose-5-phosphate reductoisomerase [Pirellulaceae bacterium]|nr:1-deoxy-D-xylulose-5-phosphate reductoisomerase [Pirellulaceae bacterium]
MSRSIRRIVILGSTGSIGRSTLEVVAASRDRLSVIGLTAHRSCQRLVDQARQFSPQWVVATDEQAAAEADWSGLPSETQLLVGLDGLRRVVSEAAVDIVVAAIVGSAGLTGAWHAVQNGKTLALANKETLVMAGPLVMAEAARCGATILPVDSEHSAVFQTLHAGRREDLKRVILTASGGPFRQYSQQQLEQVTVQEALNHPTWTMGPKITVDSATMMNKALEIIEARWLFGLEPDQIDVVIHPQSMIHSLVEFRDGSVVAQLSPPDMRLPIQYALTYPERMDGPATRFDWSRNFSWEIFPPDKTRFPALELGHEVARRGGTSGAVLNAANEAAVEAFLAGKIRFPDIVPACRSVLEHHHFDPSPSLDELWKLDAWARREIATWIGI